MVGAVDGLFGVVILLGSSLCVLGWESDRRWDQLGTTALAAFAVLLGLGGVASGVVGLLVGSGAEEIGQPLWTQLALFLWALSAVPWVLFAVEYTGRYGEVDRRTVVALYLPFVGFAFNIFWNILGPGRSGVANAVSSVVLLYCLGLVVLGAFLIVQSTYSYVHLPARYGVSLASGPIVVVVTLNSVGNLQTSSALLAVGLYALSLAVATGTFAQVVWGGRLLERTPAVETIGTQAIAEETDDLVFVVDEDDSIVECNATAAETLGTAPLLGKQLDDVLSHSSAALVEMETASIETNAGKRRYDPEVSPVTDSRGTELGAVLALRDVTERVLREQRLAVLNRVLRHNLRNKVDVIKSHAEILEDGEHVTAIRETADAITDLGNDARAIDQFVSDSTGTNEVDIVGTVEEMRRSFEPTADISVTVDLPDTAPVETNRRALAGALDSAIDNAVTYAASTVGITVEPVAGGYEVVVTDDGSGIPERELESLYSGTETPLEHSTGLGLWQLRWAVTAMGGELTFETGDGTTVRFTVPDLSESDQ